jgi:dihydroxyacetone kinase
VSIFQTMARAIGDNVGGTSGVIYALMLQAAADKLRNSAAQDSHLAAAAADACKYALSRVSFYSGAHVGDRTMLDALVPAVDAWSSGKPLVDVVAAAEAGAEHTASLPPIAGRASYVSAAQVLGHRDAGAHAAAVWIRALCNAVSKD